MTNPSPHCTAARAKPWLAIFLFSAIVAACGGGGGSGSTPTTVIDPGAVLKGFPLQAGYKDLLAKKTITEYLISGNCTGSATGTVTGTVTTESSAPSLTSFNGVDVLSKTNTVSGMVSGCTQEKIASTVINYYDSNYLALGSSSDSRYGKFTEPPSPLPTSVQIGDGNQNYGVETLYPNSPPNSAPIGRTVLSYVIELDGTSPNSAIANLITKTYNQLDQLLSVQQGRFRIVLNGTLTPVSIDVQFSTTDTSRLLFTAK